MLNRPGAPLFATINVTGICNLKCTYCFYQPRSQEVMDFESFKRIITELSNLSVFFVNISGGEPFTHPEIDKFIDFAHKKFQHVVVLTNGTLLMPHHIETIKAIIQNKGSFPIQVSIDAVDPVINMKTRYDSNVILNNLKILKDIRANIVIAMVISRFNCDCMIESITQLSRFTKFFHIMPLQSVKALKGCDKEYQLSEDKLLELWRQIKLLRIKLDLNIDIPFDDDGSDIGCATGAPCMAGFSQVVIDPTLKVRPCDRLVSTVIGDLRVSTLPQIWKSQSCMEVLRRDIPLCEKGLAV